jgi:ABC-2 type transport system ATP-binding protein
MVNPIDIVGLCKTYQRHFWTPAQTVLKGLDLEVAPGQVFGFLGPNGAGKTTTIKAMMGIIKPTTGYVRIFGKDPWDTGPKHKIGFLPETPYFYDYLTGREFMRFSGKLLGMPAQKIEHEASQMLALVKMTEAADLQMRKYSKGMLQRIGLAQALMNNPELIVLDEPLTGLDPLGRKEFKDIILALKNQGKTVFFSSHILPDAEMVCDRVAIINKGKLLRSGSLSELLNAQVKSVEFICQDITKQTAGVIKKISYSCNQIEKRWQFNLKDEKSVIQALGLLSKGPGQVISIIPQRESLEEYFTREIIRDG